MMESKIQYRLKLLEHARNCDQDVCINDDFATLCKRTKVLLSHVDGCSDRNCKFKHCRSSKFVLTNNQTSPLSQSAASLTSTSISTVSTNKRSRAEPNNKENNEAPLVTVGSKRSAPSRSTREASSSSALGPTQKEVVDNDVVTIETEEEAIERSTQAMHNDKLKLLFLLDRLLSEPGADELLGRPVAKPARTRQLKTTKNCMDLGTVVYRLKNNKYFSPAQVVNDIELTFSTAMALHKPCTPQHILVLGFVSIFNEWRLDQDY
jgi:hypothetical protein